MDTDFLICIGVNTGNSLDAADVVLTKFGSDASIVDLNALSVPMPESLANKLRLFRSVVVDSLGNMDTSCQRYEQRAIETNLSRTSVDELIVDYTLYVSDAIKELIEQTKDKNGNKYKIDLIGFHGQTCAHQPPSIAGKIEAAYTLQIGNGQLLANETGIPVVFDFRSDDLMNGGEAAPLAPVHHEHLAQHLKASGKFPIAFCNAGNTGNISIITEHSNKEIILLGWDVGPFNDYPDKLMQWERAQSCDFEGKIGSQGQVNENLLRLLFDKGAVTVNGANYFLQSPPKSSDPQWYRLLPELLGKACVGNSPLSFEDRLRTAEYFAAYVYFYSLKWIADDVLMPTCFALCGGGWNNPVSRNHFEKLLHGQFDQYPVLPEHIDIFTNIVERLCSTGRKPEIAMSDEFGFSGQYMEARLFADAAACRIKGEPFSRPETTGCLTPTVLGIIRFPHSKPALMPNNLKRWFSKYHSEDLTLDKPQIFDERWSRAAHGWNDRCKLAVKIK